MGNPMCYCTAKGEQLRSRMYIIMYINLVVAIIKMFVYGPLNSIGDLFSCAILYCGLTKLNYCNVLMYMIFCLVDAFTMFA